MNLVGVGIESMIERYVMTQSGQFFAGWFYPWKELREQGWDVTVLLSQDRTHAVAIACRAKRHS